MIAARQPARKTYITSIATVAANIAPVVIATMVHPRRQTLLASHQFFVRSDDQDCDE